MSWLWIMLLAIAAPWYIGGSAAIMVGFVYREVLSARRTDDERRAASS